MSTPIIATKLYIPSSRARVIRRFRLIDQLNLGLSSDCGLTLFSAPAGFGKTTLVSEWIISCERPTTWLSLDEAGSDSTRFLIYLITALQTILPSVGEDVLIALQSSQPAPIESALTTAKF